MKKGKSGSLVQRIRALIMVFLMMVTLMPDSMGYVFAATSEYPNSVTVKVTDESGKSLQGAKVSYSIQKDPEVVDGDAFETVSDSGTTDENGVIEVLDSTAFMSDCLLITATVSNSGYETDSTTLYLKTIETEDSNFVVRLAEKVNTPYIDNVSVKVLDSDYSSYDQELVTEVNTDTTDVEIEYSMDNATWSNQIPEKKDAGEYPIFVRISKSGYITYESGEMIAKINAIDIPGIDIEAKQFNYIEATSQNLVTLMGTLQESDTVTWTVNNIPTGKNEVPKAMAIGNYTIKLVVDRGSNYNTFTKEVTSTISNAELKLDGLTVVGLDGTYTGNAQAAVSISNKGDYNLKYQIAKGDAKKDEMSWVDEIPSVTDAGQYIIWVKAVKENYDDKDVNVTPAKNAVYPYNVYIAKAEQSFSFANPAYNDEDSSIEVLLGDLVSGKKIDFSATDSEVLVSGTISYAIDVSVEDNGIASINPSTGELNVTGAGAIIVKATLSGNDNYEDCIIQHILNVTAKRSNNGEYVEFDSDFVDYIVGNKAGISPNAAKKTFSNDKGTITYSIENGSDIGVNISNAGLVSVIDYAELISAIERNNGILKVTVIANKDEVIGCRGNVKYPKDSTSYTINMSLHEIPENAYSVYDVDNTESALTTANGTNNWYNTAVEIKPVEGYKIIRSDKIETASPSFVSSVKFGEDVNTVNQDQGGEANRIVYLQHIESGEITKKIITSVEKLDNMKPNNLNIIFPEVEENEDVKYYDEEITVTFIAYDNTSGVTKFDWEYIRANDSSESILESDSGSVIATLDTSDDSNNKYVGTLTLPRNSVDQLRGNLKVSATDVAGNTSDSVTDEGVFVVDTIAPTQTVSYQLKDGIGTMQTVKTKHYFSNDVVFTFDITEANFFSDDVDVYISKNGGANQKQLLTWDRTENTDEHEATLSLIEEGDYVISMKYSDRSGKEMTSYTSEIIVIDKTAPVISFEYKDYMDGITPQVANVTITEQNFRAKDIILDVISKNIAGSSITGSDLQQYLRNSEWTSNGDVHTATITGEFVEAIYDLTFNYTDLALNEATELKPKTFIVDRTAPKIEDMSITYSNSLLDTILSTITFGFYNPNVMVSFTAYDNTAGVDYFTWSYNRESGSSNTNVAGYADSRLTAVQDSFDKRKFTASVVLPKETAEQLRGNIAFVSTDKHNNVSNKLTDTNHVIVVDTVAPTMTVEYSTANNTVGHKAYYKEELSATFTITEANFYKEDVKVKLKKDNGNEVDITPTWTDSSTDVHVGTYTIDAADNHLNDGDYVFIVEYKDRSNNEMNLYTSDVKVVDTTIPVVKVDYSNKNLVNTVIDSEGHERKYFSSTNTATVTVTEHNFNPDDVKFTILAKDVAGNELNADALNTKSSWTTNGDNHVITITYPGDANYTFDVAYTDLTKLEAADYKEDYFTVDTTRPTDLQVSYSTSILDTVLSAVTFGFYNGKAQVTLTAKDNISSIKSMKYSYVVADGVSNLNAQLVDEVVNASNINISNDGSTGTVVFEIPKNALEADNQFNGTVNFMASDRANNETNYLRDTKRIVVDNIAPNAKVEYNTPVQQVNGISYYDGDINATVTVNEANFYDEDVKINVTRDGVATAINANWTSNSTDVHTGTFTLTGDGDYTVDITYADKSTNSMQEYTSEQMTIDTEIVEATITINGVEADGNAFKDEVIPTVSFEDKNFESCDVKLSRTSYADKNVDVTDKFIANHISTNEMGGNGSFDTFDKQADNDGIYTMTVEIRDKAGHTIEKSAKFTVNRFGSVYEYSDYLASMVADGGAYVKSIDDDFAITEYNADRLVSNSLNIEISKDGKPLDESKFTVTPDINENASTGSSGWYQYSYDISKDNFVTDGVYKISVSSKDATGNNPENTNYEDKGILFRVDGTVPEITSITGLEEDVINATEQTVKYSVYDTIGLESIVAYVDGKEVDSITSFVEDANNYAGSIVLKESSSAQTVRLVVTDKAGNVTDTDSDSFDSTYAFNNLVTVSTNIFVRWYANKPLFFGSIGGTVAVVGGASTAVFYKRRRN